MSKDTKKESRSNTKLEDLVAITLADDMDQAREYESLLKANDIPVVIKEQLDALNNKALAVMVPEDYLDEAHVVIESQETYEDFYDLALEEEQDGFDDDIFDDEIF